MSGKIDGSYNVHHTEYNYIFVALQIPICNNPPGKHNDGDVLQLKQIAAGGSHSLACIIRSNRQSITEIRISARFMIFVLVDDAEARGIDSKSF